MDFKLTKKLGVNLKFLQWWKLAKNNTLLARSKWIIRSSGINYFYFILKRIKLLTGENRHDTSE